MEKTTYETTITEEAIHHFYCDNCSVYIGSSEEYDDGYYEELGEFELRFYTPRGWYKLEKCFCHKCASEFLDKMYATLEELGFEYKK